MKDLRKIFKLSEEYDKDRNIINLFGEDIIITDKDNVFNEYICKVMEYDYSKCVWDETQTIRRYSLTDLMCYDSVY